MATRFITAAELRESLEVCVTTYFSQGPIDIGNLREMLKTAHDISATEEEAVEGLFALAKQGTILLDISGPNVSFIYSQPS